MRSSIIEMASDHNSTESWYNDLEYIYDYGGRVVPRGKATREKIGYKSIINMMYPVITCPIRQLGYKFMFAEACWILSGANDVETISKYSKDIANFSDDGVTFFGAYGPKIVEQMMYVANTLLTDPDSRQAVINIWRENPGPTKDVPCTLSIQFLIRDGMIHCVDTMRSSDLWLGHPYDIFNFSCLSAFLCILLRKRGLNLGLGQLTMTAGSKHIYSKNFDEVENVLDHWRKNGGTPKMGFCLDPLNYETTEDFASFLWSAANADKQVTKLIACG